MCTVLYLVLNSGNFPVYSGVHKGSDVGDYPPERSGTQTAGQTFFFYNNLLQAVQNINYVNYLLELAINHIGHHVNTLLIDKNNIVIMRPQLFAKNCQNYDFSFRT